MIIESGPEFRSIPIFDMDRLKNGLREPLLVRELRDVCHNIGFFYIRKHDVSPKLMRHVLTLAAAFFESPQEEKDQIKISQSPHFRGYGKLKAEITEGIPDYKETYDLGLEREPISGGTGYPYLILRGPNQWPVSEALKRLQWKENILDYIAAMQTLGKQLMEVMSLALGFPQDYLESKFRMDSEYSHAMLRLLRYPPAQCIEGQPPSIGVGPHVDAGCLVLLLQDDVGGLQVQNCSGEWVSAPPIPDTFVVNIGQMLQIWSNNYFLATPHRVINTSNKIRHSVPFFFEPNLDTIVTPLELPRDLVVKMKRPTASPETQVVYGEHMLQIYQRSFPKEIGSPKSY